MGAKAHPVLEVILERARAGSKPRERTDGHKVGLVLEGGGMRGVVTGGMVTALELLGLRNAFDAVYGTSAGAFVAAYFVAGQAAYGTSIFYEELISTKFYSMLNIFRRRPIVCLGYLTEQIALREKRLSFAGFTQSDIELHVTATSAEEGSAHVFSRFESVEELVACLAASASMPILCGAPVQIGQHRYFDGGLLQQIPYRLALEDGCTHVLVCVPRASTWPVRSWSLAEIGAAQLYLRQFSKEVAIAQLKRRRMICDDTDILKNKMNELRLPPFLYTCFLARSDRLIARMEQRQGVLLNGLTSGIRAMLRSLDLGNLKVFQTASLFSTQETSSASPERVEAEELG